MGVLQKVTVYSSIKAQIWKLLGFLTCSMFDIVVLLSGKERYENVAVRLNM